MVSDHCHKLTIVKCSIRPDIIARSESVPLAAHFIRSITAVADHRLLLNAAISECVQAVFVLVVLSLNRPLICLYPSSSNVVWSGPILYHWLAAILLNLWIYRDALGFRSLLAILMNLWISRDALGFRSLLPCFHSLYYRTYLSLYLWRIWSYTY